MFDQQQIQTNATTGNGESFSPGGRATRVTVYVVGIGTITGGTIVIEESLSPQDTGTWSAIQSITASTLSGGKTAAVHVDGVVCTIRARISSAITGGGTISAAVIGA